jgi:hypothetical protein
MRYKTREKKAMQNRLYSKSERIRTAFLFGVIMSSLLIGSLPLLAQEGDGGPKPAKLFDSGDTMSVTITAPWRDIVKNEKNQSPYPAKIEFTDDLGNTMSLDITAERRGITRQRVCDFPPIRLRFKKEVAKGTTFRGQKSVKMVTHCEKSDRYEQFYILEMLSYQMYNLITDYSFRIRPLKVDYVDSKTGKTNASKFAFLIEDDSDVAKRHGLKKLNIGKVRLSQLDPKVTSEMSIFQYMIGNIDWAALSGPSPDECCHNVKPIGPEPLQRTDTVFPIPYDFDSAGLINAPYAAPPAGVPIKSVTQRLYRGYCKTNSGLENARTTILAQEANILSLISNESLLTDKTKKKASKYLAKFFKTVKKPKDFERLIVKKCRK